MTPDLKAINLAHWEAITPINIRSAMYAHEAFKAGSNTLHSIELAALGNVAGKSILHLQCHFGQDTLSLARMGAYVTGVDFSPSAIAEAQKTAQQLQIPAEFILSDVLELNLNRQFDIVFASYGALCWIPNLDAWAAIVHQHLKPQGHLCIAEFHPTLYIYDFNTARPDYSYFNTEPILEENIGSYADPNAPEASSSAVWNHSMHDLLQPYLTRQYRLTHFEEYNYSPFNCFPQMTQIAPDRYQWNGFPQFPHVVAYTFQKP